MQNTDEKIYFNFSYYALNLLGKGLYSNAWSAISELVANGLDAQATTVKLYINMTDKEHSTIEIFDNGEGMSYKDLAEKYVLMGKNKREDNNIDDKIKNSYMGRKGIGKLAALYLSKKYYLLTKTKENSEIAWCLDSKNPKESDIPSLDKCNPSEIKIESKKEWEKISTGTMIILPDVDLTGVGVQTIEGLKARLGDFFLLDSLNGRIEICVISSTNDNVSFHEVKKSIAYKNLYVFFNNTDYDFGKELADSIIITNPNYKEIAEKKRKVQHLSVTDFDIKGTKRFVLKNGDTSDEEIPYELKGWIGLHSSVNTDDARLNDPSFLKNKAYKPNQLRLYVRNKLAVENFFDIYKNNQVFANYIEGEISFDILDDDRFEDIATTNRQSLAIDDERVQLLIDIVKSIVGKMIRTRVQLADDIKKEIDEIKFAEQKAKEEAKAREKQAQKARDAAEKAQQEAEEKAQQALEELEAEQRRSNFLEEMVEPEKRLDALITHIVKQIAGGIEKDVNSILACHYKDPDVIQKNELIEVLENTSYDMALIKQSSEMATKANFELKENRYHTDLYAFIEDYIKEIVYKDSKWGLKIQFLNPNKNHYLTTFSPAEVCLFLVNIFDNSEKYKADKLDIICTESAILFKNNGNPLANNIDKENLFRQGITTTNGGSGLGLYHCKLIAENIHGKLTIQNNKNENGVTLIMELPNEN